MQMIARADDENLLFRVGHAYEQATEWHRRKPAIARGALWSPPDPNEPRAEGIDTQWVLDAAARDGLTYVDSPMAGAIAPHVASVKAMLVEARKQLKKTAPEALWNKYLSR